MAQDIYGMMYCYEEGMAEKKKKIYLEDLKTLRKK